MDIPDVGLPFMPIYRTGMEIPDVINIKPIDKDDVLTDQDVGLPLSPYMEIPDVLTCIDVGLPFMPIYGDP